MGPGATLEQTEHVVARLEEAGAQARVSRGREATVIGAIGERDRLAALPIEGYPGVEQVLPILKPYKLVARELNPDPTVIEVAGRRIGDSYFGLIAGPCTVEYREQTLETARAVVGRRRDDAPRRRLQAAHLAVHLPGARRARPRDPRARRARRRGCRSSPR